MRSITLFCVLVFVAGAWAVPGFYWQHKLAKRGRELKQASWAIRVQHAELAHLKKQLENDAHYVEGLIRETFKHARPNELVVLLDAAAEEHVSELQRVSELTHPLDSHDE